MDGYTISDGKFIVSAIRTLKTVSHRGKIGSITRSINVGDSVGLFVDGKYTVGKVMDIFPYDLRTSRYSGARVAVDGGDGEIYFRHWEVPDYEHYNLKTATNVWVMKKNEYQVALI